MKLRKETQNLHAFLIVSDSSNFISRSSSFSSIDMNGFLRSAETSKKQIKEIQGFTMAVVAN